jgi:hypothetical protein
MKRFEVLGVCLVVSVLALSALTASSAIASAEFGQCVKTPKIGKVFKGRYKAKTCTAASEASPTERSGGGKTNKYEWVAGASPDPGFTVFTREREGLNVGGSIGLVECKTKKTDAGKGSILGPLRIEVTVALTGCELESTEEKGQACQTEGAASGEIKMAVLEGTVVEPEAGHVMIDYVAKSGDFMTFECPRHYKAVVYGSLAGNSGNIHYVNAMSKTNGFAFAPEWGGQDLEANTYNPVLKEWEEHLPVAFLSTQEFKFENSYELRQS